MKKEKLEIGNKISILLIVFICVFSGILGFVFGGVYFTTNDDVKEKNVSNENENSNDLDIIDGNTTESALCNGLFTATYYGEYKDTLANGAISLHMKRTLYLKSDGTFNSVVENSEGAWGTYTIVDGVITFTQEPSYGVGDKVIYSNTISDDCTTIYVRSEYESYDLNKIS